MILRSPTTYICINGKLRGRKTCSRHWITAVDKSHILGSVKQSVLSCSPLFIDYGVNQCSGLGECGAITVCVLNFFYDSKYEPTRHPCDRKSKITLAALFKKHKLEQMTKSTNLELPTPQNGQADILTRSPIKFYRKTPQIKEIQKLITELHRSSLPQTAAHVAN